MPPSSTISSKGQVTIPVEVRHRLGLNEGDRIEFVFEEGRTYLRPAQPQKNPFECWVGALPAFSTRREIHSWIREMRDDDESEA